MTPVPSYTGRMETSSIVPAQQDEEKVDELLRETTLPPEIAFVLKEFKEDHTGVPAVYLSFQLKPHIVLDRQALTRVSRFMTAFARTLLDHGLSRFPYVSLNEAE